MKNKIKGTDDAVRDQFTAVLERVESKINLIIDHQKISDEKFQRFEADTQDSFRALADYLVRIEAELDGELKTKVGIKEFAVLQKRVEQLEKSLRGNRLAGINR